MEQAPTGIISTEKKSFHFICVVQDSINKYMEIQSSYCDVKTPTQAEAYFIKQRNIKKYIGNKRYKIVFRQNEIIIQQPNK